jgi:hypothetical protein
MSDGSVPSFHKELFILNRSVPSLETYARIIDLETDWVVRRARALELDAPPFTSRAALMAAFDAQLEREKNEPAPSAIFLAERASREQFRVVVRQFAVDGLTEAQSFLPIIGRLPMRAQMAMVRVLIDEFGCGNDEQTHSRLYMNLLAELDLPVELGAYLEGINDESYAFVNVFHWMTQRASHPEYFLGALAYLENSIPHAFRCFADACRRLGVRKHDYYTEHVHIDGFHAKETRAALRELDAARRLHYAKTWAGIQLGSMLIGQAFDAAVARAQQEEPR